MKPCPGCRSPMPARSPAPAATPRAGPASGRFLRAPAPAFWRQAWSANKRCQTGPSRWLRGSRAPEEQAASWPHGEMNAAVQAAALMADRMPAHVIGAWRQLFAGPESEAGAVNPDGIGGEVAPILVQQQRAGESRLQRLAESELNARWRAHPGAIGGRGFYQARVGQRRSGRKHQEQKT